MFLNAWFRLFGNVGKIFRLLLRTTSKKYAPGAVSFLNPPVLQTLLNSGWPGNMWELRNVMERVALLAARREVALNDLPPALLGAAETVAAFPEEDRLLTLRELEERQIRLVLNLGVSMDRAAELLGITSVPLWRKRKELCLRWDCAEVDWALLCRSQSNINFLNFLKYIKFLKNIFL